MQSELQIRKYIQHGQLIILFFGATASLTVHPVDSSDSTLNLESMNPEFIFCVCFDLLKMDFYFGIKTDKVKVNCLSLKFVFTKKLTITI